MKLSVIVAAYNAEKTIGRCLDSLLCAVQEDYEIIVVNDGSKDGTGEIVKAHAAAHPEIKLVETENGGQGRARNIALEKAEGEFIGFCDSDDFVLPDMFEKMLRAAEREKADIAICDFYRVCGEEKNYEKAALQNHPLSSAGAVWNKLFRREIIGDARFAEGLWYEDLLFSGKLLMKSRKTVFINEALYCYVFGHSSTMTNSNSQKNLDIIKVVEELRQYNSEMDLGADTDFLVINHVLLEAVKRVAVQNSPERDEVLSRLLAYVKDCIPKLSRCGAFRKESRNRRIIMGLLYGGHIELAMRILKI